jgi:Prolyl oligopeptidase, N-terminal beta-propeller domain
MRWREGLLARRYDRLGGSLDPREAIAPASPPLGHAPRRVRRPRAARPGAADPYWWMEGNDNAEFSAWLKAQGDCTEHYLGRIAAREVLLKRLRELGLGTSSERAMHLAGGRASRSRNVEHTSRRLRVRGPLPRGSCLGLRLRRGPPRLPPSRPALRKIGRSGGMVTLLHAHG